MRAGAAYFLEPSEPAQRRYEAMRAYFVDGLAASEGPCAMEDRPGRDRRLTPADRALPPTATQPPAGPADAPRAAEPVRPAQPFQVVQASRLVREPRKQLRVRAWIVLARLRHSTSLPELDRYPILLVAG